MIKHVSRYEMFTKLENCKAKSLMLERSHEATDERKAWSYYIYHALIPDYTMHVGTNDLNSNRPPNLLAESIVDLAITLKNNLKNASVSNVIIVSTL